MQPNLSLSSPIKEIPTIGPVYQRKLSNVGIETVSDLLYYFPFRYEDLSARRSIGETEEGETITIKATLWQITKIRTKTGKIIIKATFNDETGAIDVVWFNQIYLLTVLKPNMLVNLSGKVGIFGTKKTLINPSYEIIKDSLAIPIHTERLVPVYSESSGVSSKWIRTKIHQLLSQNLVQVKDFLDSNVLKKEGLIDLKLALNEIHFPTSIELASEARQRLAFDELLVLQIRNLVQKQERKKENSLKFKIFESKISDFKQSLPFKLTISQEVATNEILEDLGKDGVMNRLLQGEVGSGKTVVSCFPILATILNGYQAAFLAPTEILAKQHFQTISTFLGKNFKVELHTGSVRAKTADFDIVVGTHALLNKGLTITNLGLVVVDEQQRFGVVQRSFLKNQKNPPHLLTMTATPIPRTLALTLYGNLDISTLAEIPQGRLPIKTYFVPRVKRASAYDFVKKEIKKGGQAFIICPLIEISESLVSVKSAKAEFERLTKEIFPELKLGLLHGKLNNSEKDQVTANFRTGKLDILVSTAVVEVGIDIPNASIMLIEASERFGLASLHQLRGRVGRGTRQSYCLLFTEVQNVRVISRLKLLEKYNDGLKLAEMDLEKRGAGDLFGTAQSGQFNLKLASSINSELIIKSRKAAESMIEDKIPVKIKNKIDQMEATEFIDD